MTLPSGRATGQRPYRFGPLRITVGWTAVWQAAANVRRACLLYDHRGRMTRCGVNFDACSMTLRKINRCFGLHSRTRRYGCVLLLVGLKPGEWLVPNSVGTTIVPELIWAITSHTILLHLIAVRHHHHHHHNHYHWLFITRDLRDVILFVYFSAVPNSYFWLFGRIRIVRLLFGQIQIKRIRTGLVQMTIFCSLQLKWE